MSTLLKVGLLAGAAYYLANKLTDLDKKIGVKLGSISFNKTLTQGANFFKIFFNVNLSINNASALQGTIKGGTINLIINNRLLATVSNIQSFTIDANKSVNISLPVGINSLSLFSNILDVIALVKGGGSIVVNVKGDILTNVGTIIINESKTVTV
jgi:hypothetical protein